VTQRTVNKYLPHLRLLRPDLFRFTIGPRELELDRWFAWVALRWGRAMDRLNVRLNGSDQELLAREMTECHFRCAPLSSCAALGAPLRWSADNAKEVQLGLPSREWWFAFDSSMGDDDKEEREAFQAAFFGPSGDPGGGAALRGGDVRVQADGG
jgi:hypothetical protein